jgi:crossover junction endodeoxyribonuclease RuvC
MSVWLGVDPGLAGALALVSNEGLLGVIDMPKVSERHGKESRDRICAHTLRDELINMQYTHGKIRMGLVELVGPMPQQGVTSSFRFGYGAGQIEGVLAALCIPTEFVRPQTWKKHLGLGADKAQSLALARAKWPYSDDFKLKKHDGRAEAALLAEYGRRIGL